MGELAWCEYWCGTLTEAQRATLATHMDEFRGVARPIARLRYCPMLTSSSLGLAYVILEDGSRTLAAEDGQRFW